MSGETYLVGIAGPSGSGKSFLASYLKNALQAEVLQLDRYYRDLSHMLPAERAKVNFDSPDALEHELLIEQVTRLRSGEAVQLPVYDFATHTRCAHREPLQPAPVIIVEGLFTLHWPGLRELLGTKVYVDLHDEICLARRTTRDVRERGRTVESVREQYEATVAPMARRYVRPTIEHADVVVCGAQHVGIGVARVVEHYRRSRS